MITKQFSFLSADRHTRIYAVKWLPDNQQYNAVLQITHGMMEHIMRYQEFAEFLTTQGFLVVGHDHLGHGRTAVTAEKLGYFAKSSPSDVLIADMHQLYRIISGENPGLPYFILGHSMGSYLFRKFLATYQDPLAGALIIGTGFIPPAKTLLGLTLVHCIVLIKGWHHRSPLITKLTFGNSYHSLPSDSQQDSGSWLTRDLEIIKKNKADPYANFRFTLNGYKGLFQTVFFVCLQKNIKKIPKGLPVLIASGDQDPVGDMGKGVEKVYQLFQDAGIQDLQCKLYPGARHEILNEINRQEIYGDLLNWMKAHL